MSNLEIILMSYLGLVLLGAIIQSYYEMGRKPSILEFFITTFIGIPSFFAYNLFITPFVAIINFFKLNKNPEPKTFNIFNFDENELDEQLFALGFVKVENRVTLDNIPYSGYVYYGESKIIPIEIIIANDYALLDKAVVEGQESLKRRFLRVSIYAENNRTKYIVDRLKYIRSHYTILKEGEEKKSETLYE